MLRHAVTLRLKALALEGALVLQQRLPGAKSLIVDTLRRIREI